MRSARSGSRIPVLALLGANAVSQLGEALTSVAIPWYVYETTGSAARLGIVGFFTLLPRVLAMFLAGPLVDRLGYKPVSIVTDILSALSVGAIPLLDQTIGLSFPMLLALVFLGAAFDGPGATARESMVPDLIARSGLPADRVNGAYHLVQRFAMLLGPVLAGVLIAMIGTSSVLYLDALTFLISALSILILVPAIRASVHDQSAQGGISTLLDGWRFIRADRLLICTVALVATLNFFDAPLTSVLLPVYVADHYGGAEQVGLLRSCLGGGAVTSSLAFAVWGHRLSRYRVFVLAFLCLGLPYWLLMTAPPFPLVLVALAAMGIAAGPINPVLMAVKQQRVPDYLRARVFGTITSIAWIAMPFGQLIGGYAVQAAGPQAVFGMIATGYLLVTLSMQRQTVFRQMDTLDKPAHSPR